MSIDGQSLPPETDSTELIVFIAIVVCFMATACSLAPVTSGGCVIPIACDVDFGNVLAVLKLQQQHC